MVAPDAVRYMFVAQRNKGWVYIGVPRPGNNPVNQYIRIAVYSSRAIDDKH
jgi:hypothetical protein